MSEPLKYTCKRVSSITYALRSGGEYADITIREWPGGGSIGIQSSFGSYANTWNAVGDEPFRKFLCGLDMSYFFSKCIGSDCLEFDCEATVKEIKREIIKFRKEDEIEHGVAREIWDSLPDLNASSGYEMVDGMGEHAFDKMVVELYGGDRSAIPFMTRTKCDCRNFWEQIWPCACEVWRKELAEESGEFGL